MHLTIDGSSRGARPSPPTGPVLGLAVLLPCVLAVEYGPLVGQLQEQVSYGLWALWMTMLAWQRMPPALTVSRPTLVLTGLLLTLATWALTQSSVWLQAPHRGLLSFFLLAAAAALVLTGTASAQMHGESDLRWMLIGLLAAGLINSGIALVQVLSPQTADDVWIAQGFVLGRANGNLRQPNQLAALLLMALIALWALMPASRRGHSTAVALATPLLLGIVLTASRFGLACTLLVIIHAMARPWAPALRGRAALALISLALMWGIGWLLTTWTGGELALNERLVHETASGSRWPLWHATLRMIQAHPWLGAGWGEFNRVWMLTPKTLATPHSFSNAHNLPLQWAAELGLPMALAACGAVLIAWWALWRPDCAAHEKPPSACLRRAVALMATVLLLYSLIEYPLWYSRFLLPLCFAVGWAGYSAGGPPLRLPAWRLLTATLLVAVLAAHLDYRSTAGLKDMRGLDAQQQEDRVARARRSFLYSGIAFRATALSMHNDPMASAAVGYAGQDFLDLELMRVWAEALDATGQRARAQYLMDRMTEMGAPRRKGGCDRPEPGTLACLEEVKRLGPDDFR